VVKEKNKIKPFLRAKFDFTKKIPQPYVPTVKHLENDGD
jgi:hypothetical protein